MPIGKTIGNALVGLGERLMGKRLSTGGDWAGDDSTRAFLDAMGVVRKPGFGDLIREFEGIAYTCAMENAKAVASVPFRLFVTTGPGDARAKCRTKSVGAATMKRLAGRKDLRARLSKAVVVEEVEDHAMLDWLYAGGQQLWLQSSLYLDVVGQAFWRPGKVEGGLLDGMPMQLVVMPAHEIAPIEGKTIAEALLGWKWGQQKFAPEDLIWFRWPSLTKPWTGCYSPTAAAWTDILLGDKAASHLHEALDKSPPVSYIVSPEGQPNAMPMGDTGMGEGPLKRLDDDLKKRLFIRRQRVIVAGIPLKVQTLAQNTRELELAVQRGFSREVVAMCYGVPPAMLTTQTNLDNLKAALRQHAKQAVEPRCILFDEAINQQVVKLFDPDERLFLAHDDCVPADVQAKIAQEMSDSNTGKRCINEMRAEDNLDPIPGGDEPLVATGRAPLSQVVGRDLNAMQSFFGQARPAPAATDAAAEPIPDAAAEPLPEGDGEAAAPAGKPGQAPPPAEEARAALLEMVGGISGMIEILDALAAGTMTRETAIQMVMLFFRVSREQAESLINTSGNVPPEKLPEPPPADDATEGANEAAKARHAAPDAARRAGKRHGAACGCRDCGLAATGGSGRRRVVDPAAGGKQAGGDGANPRVNVHGLPDGRALEGAMRPVIRRQRKAILTAIRANVEAALKSAGTKALADLPGIDWDDWDEEFAKACAPVMQLYAEQGAREAIARLGATDEEAAWRVQLPQVKEAIARASMQFAKSTNETTSMQLDAALLELRSQLEEGILEGPNTLRDLTRRVEGIFDTMERDRARMIAATEASRAVHTGQLIAAEQSGMVAGIRWLAHPGACPICEELAGQSVELGEAFLDDGSGGAYAIVMAPPAHPDCMCSMTEVLRPLAELLAEADAIGEGYKIASWHVAAKSLQVWRAA